MIAKWKLKVLQNELILQYFWPALPYNWSWKQIVGLFESGHFTQVLLYILDLWIALKITTNSPPPPNPPWSKS